MSDPYSATNRRVDLDETAEQARDVPSDPPLAGRRMIDGPSVDEEGQRASGPESAAAASRSSRIASWRSITWVAPIAVSASRRNRSE